MNRRGLLLLWGLIALLAHLIPALLPGVVSTPPARADLPEKSAETLDYEIHANLDAKTREIMARGTLTWRNQSPEPVTEMRLHLYLNAFKNERSTFMRESLGSHRGHRFDKRAPGKIDLLSFKRKDGENLIDPAKLEFVTDDDGNTDDQTVVRIALKEPVPAEGEATFEIEWKSTMPKVFARTGFGGSGAFFMVAQWYPKPGVWEKGEIDGEQKWHWNCHQFHGSSEFYADYGAYDVHLTVPWQFRGKVGATGLREGKGTEIEEVSVTYRHKAEHVHDFAWVCGEEFKVEEIKFEGGAGTSPEEQQRVAKILGRDPKELDLSPVTCYFLLQPEHMDQLERHKNAVFHALTYMGFWFGEYPYDTLTVVDPDHRGRDAGGMEYPTLITGGTRYIRAAKQLSPEGVLIHEFGHQHFYGLVGTNEFRNAWMDEGMNTYATGKVQMAAYDGWTASTEYAGFPVYGEPAFAFRGFAAEARKALPLIGPVLDEQFEIPFGELGIVQSIAEVFGVKHPKERISLWGGYGEITPISFLREIPTLTHLHTLPASAKEWGRTSNARRPIVDPISGRRAWEYMDRSSYGNNSYRRTASSLRTLEDYVGEETMVRIMRTYCERYRFKHPHPQHFFDVVAEVAEKDGKGDVRWILPELFESTAAFDFGVGSVDVKELPKIDPKDEEEKPGHESLVTLRRYEGVRFPADVRVRFDDGSVREFFWDRDDSLREYETTHNEESQRVVRGKLGDELSTHEPALSRVTPKRDTQQRWAKLRFRGEAKVVSAEVDPHYHFSLDRDRTNNGRTVRPNPGASVQIALRALGWVELTNSFYGGL